MHRSRIGPVVTVPVLLLVLLLLVPACSQPAPPSVAETGERISPYEDVRSKNLQNRNFRANPDSVWTLTFDTATRWPDPKNLPPDFDPKKVLEWGKSPGLGVSRVHQAGVTGKGVAVAIIDQALSNEHEELAGIRLVYMRGETSSDFDEQTSMHGPAVASVLAGLHIGVAPGVTLYYWPISSKSRDQGQFADALSGVVRQNQQIPPEQRIRAVSISTAPDLKQQGGADFAASIVEAEAAGILVVTVEQPFQLMPITSRPYFDKDNAASWERAGWVQGYSPAGRLLVPTSGRTLATGVPNSRNAYAYYQDGGLSWAVPYVVGTLALGWQVDPNLPNDLAIQYIMDSGTGYMSGKIISPYQYVERVRLAR